MSKHTPLSEDIQRRLPGPELVAKTIADLVVKPRREVVVPGFYSTLVGIERVFPSIVDLVIRLSRS